MKYKILLHYLWILNILFITLPPSPTPELWNTRFLTLPLCLYSGKPSTIPFPYSDTTCIYWTTVTPSIHSWSGHQHHPFSVHMLTAQLCRSALLIVCQCASSHICLTSSVVFFCSSFCLMSSLTLFLFLVCFTNSVSLCLFLCLTNSVSLCL